MLKFSEFRLLSEATKDLLSAIGSTKTATLLKKKVIPAIQKHHDNVFGVGNNHLEFPLENDIPDHVKDHVEKQGDSLGGGGVKLKSGREVPVSKYLARSNAPKNVQDEHQNWEKNKVSNSKLVITRNPAEVASASTGTHWSSCANPNGKIAPAWKAMPHEVKHGTLMAMHVNKDAKVNEHGEYDSKDILGRVLIKHHKPEDVESTPDNDKEISFHQEGKKYGAFPEAAKKVVDEFAKKNYPQTNLLSHKHEDLYDDDGNSIKVNFHHPDIEHAFTHEHKKELSGHIQSSIVNHPNVDEKTLGLAANSMHTNTKIAVAVKTKNPETLNKIFHSNDIEGEDYRTNHDKASALKNPHATKELITAGLNHHNAVVRTAAAGSNNTTTEHITKAIHDDDHWVQGAVDPHKLNSEHHKYIKDNMDKKDSVVIGGPLRIAAAKSKNLPDEDLHTALHTKNIARHAIEGNPNITKAHLLHALGNEHLDAATVREIVSHPKADDEVHKAATSHTNKNVVGWATNQIDFDKKRNANLHK